MKRITFNNPLFGMLALVAAATLGSVGSAEAGKIQYQVMNVPVTFDGVPIDLDGDGVNDFVFVVGGRPVSGEFCMVTPAPDCSVVATSLFAEGVGYQQPLSGRRTWSEKPSYLMQMQPGGEPEGDWAAVGTELFVGLRIRKEPGVWNYGWARLRNEGGPAGFMLRDWAVEMQYDLPIMTATLGDITMDGVVNVNDLLQVISAWGVCEPPICPGDVNNDSMVDVTDLLMVIANWSTP